MIQWLIDLYQRARQYLPWNWVHITYPNMLVAVTITGVVGCLDNHIVDVSTPNSIPLLAVTLHFHNFIPMDFNRESNRYILVLVTENFKLLTMQFPNSECSRLLDRRSLDHHRSHAILKDLPDHCYVDNYGLKSGLLTISIKDMKILKEQIQEFWNDHR